MNLDRYAGLDVEIIYQDKSRRISQRKIRIQSVRDGKVRAFDLEQKAPRMFAVEGILAYQPVIRKRFG